LRWFFNIDKWKGIFFKEKKIEILLVRRERIKHCLGVFFEGKKRVREIEIYITGAGGWRDYPHGYSTRVILILHHPQM
jgi:hypothetical protein